MNNVARPIRLSFTFPCVIALCLSQSNTAGAAGPPGAAEPLHVRIDAILDAGLDHPAAAQANDAEFLRRLSIDLTDMPPSVAQLKAFFADSSADRREKAIDRLLESPQFARHLATALDIMFMERRPAKEVPDADWQAYLYQFSRENRPINELYRDILKADGADATTRPGVRFFLDRTADPNLITRDVGRIVFGRDMQCAQCHNHPLISDYLQPDYHGLLAFFASSVEVKLTEGKATKHVFADNAAKDQSFDSVFVKNDKHLSAPRVPGELPLVEKAYPVGDEYIVKPADNVMQVPRHRRRIDLAEYIAAGKSQAFNENVANRLWALMMGRGLVHPVDLHHAENPPSHPELMKLLASELVSAEFNVRAFLREIALTKAYGRSLDFPRIDPSAALEVSLRIADTKRKLKPLNLAVDQAKNGHETAVKDWYAAETEMIAALAPVDAAIAKHVESAKARDAAAKALADATSQVASRKGVFALTTDASKKADEVVKNFPNDKDLAVAAQKFSDKRKALETELASLEKTIPDKTLAAKKAADALVPFAKAVEDARVKAEPARARTRQKEQAVVTARASFTQARLAAEDVKRRLKALESQTDYLALNERANTIKSSIKARGDALAKAELDATSAGARLSQGEQSVKVAEQVKLVADKRVAEANALIDLHQKRVASMLKAVEAAEAARSLLSDDAVLADAHQKLKARAEEIRLQMAEPAAKRNAAQTAWRSAGDGIAVAVRDRDATQKELAKCQAAVKAARQALEAETTQQKSLDGELASSLESVSNLWSNEFALAQLKPLSPEQLAWSIMKVNNVYENYWNQESAELNKTKPLTDKAKADPAQMKQRDFEVEQRVYDKLKGTLPAFVQAYAAGAGQPQNDFFATVDQALFVSNGGTINSWIAPMGNNVSARMVAEKDPAKAASDLYLTIFGRQPSLEEVADVTQVLNEQAKNKPSAVQELVWGLVMSTEFRFNH